MKALEGYVFLATLKKWDFSCPVRIYVFKDEARSGKDYPSINRYALAGQFNKSIKIGAIETILNDSSPKYFQKKKGQQFTRLFHL